MIVEIVQTVVQLAVVDTVEVVTADTEDAAKAVVLKVVVAKADTVVAQKAGTVDVAKEAALKEDTPVVAKAAVAQKSLKELLSLKARLKDANKLYCCKLLPNFFTE
jgi:hypothetical protein